MRVIVISIVVGVLGTVQKGIKKMEELEIRGRIETIQTMALLKLTRIFRFCHSDSTGKPPGKDGGKNS